MNNSRIPMLNDGDTASLAPLQRPDEDVDRLGRFGDRTKRLARRQESDVFRHYLMPLTWILGLAGLLGLSVLWIGEGASAMTHSPVFPVLSALFGAPVLTTLLRALRGHFHSAVREL